MVYRPLMRKRLRLKSIWVFGIRAAVYITPINGFYGNAAINDMHKLAVKCLP